MRARVRSLSGLFGLAAIVALAGCAGLPKRESLSASHAVPLSSQTTLGKMAAGLLPFAQASGFELMATGRGALHARLELIARAEQSLDLQYFEFAGDRTGAIVARALCDAAARGVRVRLLVDDSQTLGTDPLLLGLALRSHIEVRVFNPFTGGRARSVSRLLELLGEFSRLNSRMHNKLLVADGAFAIGGGRNIADAYFARDGAEAFVDLDLLMTGAVVPELASTFDAYWNHPRVFSIESVAGSIGKAEAALALSQWLEAAPAPHDLSMPLFDRLGHRPLRAELDQGLLALRWGTARVFADSPDKANAAGSILGHPAPAARDLRDVVWDEMAVATNAYTIITPYLVPSSGGMAQVRRNRARGVKISILTNSLASTDVPLVHAAYQRYREPMLRQGVELHELSVRLGAALTGEADPTPPTFRLHAKCVVFDRDTVFIGSLNFDPRSMRLNTEIGVIVRSPALAEDVLDWVDIAYREASYAVSLDADERLTWTPPPGGTSHQVQRTEPDAGAARRLFKRIAEPLVPESLL